MFSLPPPIQKLSIIHYFIYDLGLTVGCLLVLVPFLFIIWSYFCSGLIRLILGLEELVDGIEVELRTHSSLKKIRRAHPNLFKSFRKQNRFVNMYLFISLQSGWTLSFPFYIFWWLFLRRCCLSVLCKLSQDHISIHWRKY